MFILKFKTVKSTAAEINQSPAEQEELEPQQVFSFQPVSSRKPRSAVLRSPGQLPARRHGRARRQAPARPQTPSTPWVRVPLRAPRALLPGSFSQLCGLSLISGSAARRCVSLGHRGPLPGAAAAGGRARGRRPPEPRGRHWPRPLRPLPAPGPTATPAPRPLPCGPSGPPEELSAGSRRGREGLAQGPWWSQSRPRLCLAVAAACAAGGSLLRGVLYLYWSNLAYCSHSSGLLSYDSISAWTSSTLTLSSANIWWRIRISSSRLRAFQVSVCTGCSIIAGRSRAAASRCPGPAPAACLYAPGGTAGAHHRPGGRARGQLPVPVPVPVPVSAATDPGGRGQPKASAAEAPLTARCCCSARARAKRGRSRWRSGIPAGKIGEVAIAAGRKASLSLCRGARPAATSVTHTLVWKNTSKSSTEKQNKTHSYFKHTEDCCWRLLTDSLLVDSAVSWKPVRSAGSFRAAVTISTQNDTQKQ